MQRYAMLSGTYMGIFWILKFVLIPTGMTTPLLLFLFLCLTLCVPFLAFRYTKAYRNNACDGSISFLHAWAFNVFMFICASLLTSVAHYVYFEFIDQGFLYESILQAFKQENTLSDDFYAPIEQSINFLVSSTPTEITLKMLADNIYNSTLLSIPIALFAMKRKSPQADENQA